ncbi:cytosine-specific methyltransferase, partial [Striga asiatica]
MPHHLRPSRYNGGLERTLKSLSSSTISDPHLCGNFIPDSSPSAATRTRTLHLHWHQMVKIELKFSRWCTRALHLLFGRQAYGAPRLFVDHIRSLLNSAPLKTLVVSLLSISLARITSYQLRLDWIVTSTLQSSAKIPMVGNAVAVHIARALRYSLALAIRGLSGESPLLTLPDEYPIVKDLPS